MTHTLSSRSAFTLVEAVIAIGVVGVLVAAVMNAAGAAGQRRAILAQQAAADTLCDSVLAEVAALPVDDPNNISESGTTRATRDNLLDFAAWSESPPTTSSGGTIPGASNWTLLISVLGNDPSNPAADGAAAGIYKVTVTIKAAGKVLSTLQQHRTRAWDNARR